MKGFFVTGTDTDVGKTVMSALLAHALRLRCEVCYFKPIQAGTPRDQDRVAQLCDFLLPIKTSSYELEAPMSPDRAAAKQGLEIELNKISLDCEGPSPYFHIVEGAGGVEVPINSQESVLDLMAELRLPVVLVSSTRLGTINHTLLSIKSLKQRGLDCVGIILTGDKDPGLSDLIAEKSGVKNILEVPFFSSLTSESLKKFISKNKYVEAFIDRLFNTTQDRDLDALVRWDKDFVWHPFTQHGIVQTHPLVTRAEGSFLWLKNHKVIDGISSWWVNLFGHCHKGLSSAIEAQLSQLEHVIFAGFTHEPAIRLSKTLIEMTQEKGCQHKKVFFSDNGSTSIEVALKMVFQYFQQLGQEKKRRFLALKGSYHGDTLGAMSIGERAGFNEVFTPLMFDVDFVDPYSVTDLENYFAQEGDECAGVVLEPMIQGASGMRMYPVEFLNRLADLAKEYKTYVICDEIFTGFYRTGKMFAFEHSKLKPDLLCLSKGLTGGYLPLSVTLVTDDLYHHFSGDSMRMAFLHGHSYTANPLACAVANATLELINKPATNIEIQRIVNKTEECLLDLKKNHKILNVRQLGTIGAMEIIDSDPNYFKGDFSYRFNQKAIAKGVLLRPLGGTVYAVPPYCIGNAEIEKIYRTIAEIVDQENFI